jgi:hypothetical protein
MSREREEITFQKIRSKKIFPLGGDKNIDVYTPI